VDDGGRPLLDENLSNQPTAGGSLPPDGMNEGECFYFVVVPAILVLFFHWYLQYPFGSKPSSYIFVLESVYLTKDLLTYDQRYSF
jgi:hypothetical protein